MTYTWTGAQYGIGFGTALAIAISYDNNQSILWAIIHGFFSWLYVIYFRDRLLAGLGGPSARSSAACVSPFWGSGSRFRGKVGGAITARPPARLRQIACSSRSPIETSSWLGPAS